MRKGPDRGYGKDPYLIGNRCNARTEYSSLEMRRFEYWEAAAAAEILLSPPPPLFPISPGLQAANYAGQEKKKGKEMLLFPPPLCTPDD